MNLIKAYWFASLVLVTPWQLVRGDDPILSYGGTPPASKFPLEHCEGDCDDDCDCAGDMICNQRDGNEAVPGCEGGEDDGSRTDYCIHPPNSPTPLTPTFPPTNAPTPPTQTSATPTPMPTPPPTFAPTTATPTAAPTPMPTPSPVETLDLPDLQSFGGDPPGSRFPLGRCQGDCDNNGDCAGNMICHQRGANEVVPGCIGGEADGSRTDYCINPINTAPTTPGPTPAPTVSPTNAPTTVTPTPMPTPAPTFAPTPLTQIISPTNAPTTATPTPMPTPPPTFAPTTATPTPMPTPSPVETLDLPDLQSFGGDPPGSRFPLGRCQGDCDNNGDCAGNMICHQRGANEAVPGCFGGEADGSRTDYCINPINTAPTTPRPTPAPTVSPTNAPTTPMPDLQSFGGSPPAERFPLGLCEGDCDVDGDCADGLVCFERGPNDEVPGCAGNDASDTDYCADPDFPNFAAFVTQFTPGKLTVSKLGLLLSEGLDARLIAEYDWRVPYHDGTESDAFFHGRPDAGATFPDPRAENLGGWVYVSNSEMPRNAQGGVGALTFDANGNVIDYRMVLQGSTMNCGGGRTPWNTWVSCEENGIHGRIFQVDPFGVKAPELMPIGAARGNWESFAYNIDDEDEPQFFVTEDFSQGAIRRFIPSDPVWSNEWGILQGNGTIDYLLLNHDLSDTNGTFTWTTDLNAARLNALALYPNTEGIDAFQGQLLFVSKVRRQIFTLDLNAGTWFASSTVSGLFDGQPDQMQRLLGDSRDMLYFTEEGGVDAGIHARDIDSRFYTIMESPVYPGETTGLALSPDGKFMYVAYQNLGLLFSLFRKDGKSFAAEHLDVNYHHYQR
jgi:hypothetical protein